MVRPPKKTSHRATAKKAKKSVENLQTLFGNLGINSPTPSPPPGCSQALAAEPYVEDSRVRIMFERLIKWNLWKCNLIQRELLSHSEMEDYIESDSFRNLCLMIWTKLYLWMSPMKDICRALYFDLTSSSQNYVKYMFKVLRQIHARDLPFYDNMVAGCSFVLCATAYFCHNGWDQALKHSYRVLVTYFESQLRIPFSRAGGFSGLSKFCRVYDMPDFFGEPRFRPEALDIQKQHSLVAREEIEGFMHTLNIVDDGDSDGDPDLILTTLAFHNHLDLTVKWSRNTCGDWFFKDKDLPQHILKNMKSDQVVEKRAQSYPTVEQLRDTIHENSIVDPDILNGYVKVIEEFISSMHFIDKMAESVVD